MNTPKKHDHNLSRVCIVGRANVGKSTIFNRFIRGRLAIVQDFPGVTRDRKEGIARLNNNKSFVLIDTGGMQFGLDDDLGGKTRFQVETAIAVSDLILFVVDVKDGILPLDEQIAGYLRQSEKSVLLVVNKVDNPSRTHAVSEFFALGFGAPVSISSEHGIGFEDLRMAMDPYLTTVEYEEPEALIKVAVVGKPNAGKSSLINCLLGFDRLIVSETPGTTRDSIDTRICVDGQDYLLIDTAGIRRRGKVRETLEKYCVIMALKSLERADVALLILDADSGITEQDMRIAGYIKDAGRACLLVVNKWDLVDHTNINYAAYLRDVQSRLHHVAFAPVITISSQTGKRTRNLFDVITRTYLNYQKKIPTSELNKVIQDSLKRHAPGLKKSRQPLKIYYATQTRCAPPTILIYANYPKFIHFTYLRFLENQIRKRFDFEGTPIRLVLKGKKRK